MPSGRGLLPQLRASPAPAPRSAHAASARWKYGNGAGSAAFARPTIVLPELQCRRKYRARCGWLNPARELKGEISWQSPYAAGRRRSPGCGCLADAAGADDAFRLGGGKQRQIDRCRFLLDILDGAADMIREHRQRGMVLGQVAQDADLVGGPQGFIDGWRRWLGLLFRGGGFFGGNVCRRFVIQREFVSKCILRSTGLVKVQSSLDNCTPICAIRLARAD